MKDVSFFLIIQHDVIRIKLIGSSGMGGLGKTNVLVRDNYGRPTSFSYEDYCRFHGTTNCWVMLICWKCATLTVLMHILINTLLFVCRLAIITTNLDGVLQLGNTAMGVLAGPILAVFLLGFFTTTSNKYGAITGMICGNAFTIWLLVGSLVKDLPRSPSTALPTYTEGCGRNSSFDLDVYGIAKNHSQVQQTFFYIPEG